VTLSRLTMFDTVTGESSGLMFFTRMEYEWPEEIVSVNVHPLPDVTAAPYNGVAIPKSLPS
jgi:hypothetical protein